MLTSDVLMDAHYTPSILAAKMVRSARTQNPRVIADFAVGEGSLLTAAQARWPDAKLLGIDIDRRVVRALRRAEPGWNVGVCDFLNPRSVQRSAVLQELREEVDLVLLNPPFSCRGGSRVFSKLDGKGVACSPAAAFVLGAIELTGGVAEIIAILPAGTLHNEKDAQAWGAIDRRYTIERLREYGKETFDGCSPTTSVVRLKKRGRRSKGAAQPERAVHEAPRLQVEVVRGCTPMYAATHRPAPGERALLHSTDIRDGLAKTNGWVTAARHRTAAAPAVVLPRVGQLTEGKIGLLKAGSPVALSDCVIALQCESDQAATLVQERLVNAMDSVSAAYVGTGAPFITVGRLRHLLDALAVTCL